MSLMRKLSTLGLRPLVEGACRILGGEAGEALGRGVTEMLARRFGDDSQRLEQVLREAHERAWKALEIALGGDSFWERCKARLSNPGDRSLRDQLRAFLDSVPAAQLPAERDEFRRECLRELRDARHAGLLNPPPLDARGLAGELGAFARFTEPQKLLQAERSLAEGVAADLRGAGHAFLAQLLTPGSGPSLLVVALRYFLRRAIADDERLARGLTFAQLDGLHQGQEQGFAALHAALADHGGRVEDLLGELHRLVAETHSAVLDLREELARQGEQNRALYEAVLGLQRRLDLMHTELRPRDSLSIRNDGERRLVKQLVARYRALPPEQKQQLPALLNAVGKLEVAAGSFELAEQDFAALAGLVEDPRARAEAHYNASRAALEARDWNTALREVLQAARLDPRRFAPFPLGKYTPQRILGAGGFGVAYLCTHRYMETPVVVKTLLDDLDRGIEQLFAEAQALRKLNHPGIVRVQDCGYTDAANRARPFLVMDYFPGCTLEEHVRNSGVLVLKRFLPLARQIAEALQAAHVENVLHRDVKPGNLLVRAEGPAAPLQAQLIDFGLALRQSVLAQSSQRSRTLMGASIAGTLDYAAPEQLGKLPGTPVGPYSDVYGFGKTCCFALFGTTQPVLKHWQSIPEPLADLLGRCLSDLPGERPADFAAVLRCLDTLNAAPAAKPALRSAPPPPPVDEDEDERKEPPRRKQAIRTQGRFEPRTRRRVCEEDEGEERERRRPRRPVPPWVWAVVGGGALLLFGLILVIVAATSSGRSKSLAEKGAGAEQEGLRPPLLPVEEPNEAEIERKGSRVYLSDLEEFDVKPGPWPFGKNGWQGADGREPIRLAGKPALKGLGMHPPSDSFSRVRYHLGRKATTFEATAGLADSTFPVFGAIGFEVLGDGRLLWKSALLRRAGASQRCRISVKGVNVLELRTTVQGNETGAHAVWVDPCVWRPDSARLAGEAPPPPPPLPPPAVAEKKEGEIAWKDGRAYLSDLKEFDVKAGPWPFSKNGGHGDNGRQSITVGGTAAPKGLSMHPPTNDFSRVRYHLNRQAATFEATVALADSAVAVFGVIGFEVVGDGKLLWKSEPIRRKGRRQQGGAQSCRISVRGVDVLELRTTVQGNQIGAHAVWVDPVVFRAEEAAPAAVWKTGPARRVADLSVRTLCDGAAGLLPVLANSADGKSFYALESNGVLRRIDWQTLEEKKRVDLGHPGVALAVSRLGVLVLLDTPLTELWLLDDATLKKLKSGPLPGAVSVLSAPSLTLALAEYDNKDERAVRLSVLDLARFVPVRGYTDAQLNPGTIGIASGGFRMTPDGKYVLGRGSSGKLQRWQLARRQLTHEESGPALVKGAEGVVVVGGKWVCLLHPKGNEGAAPYSTNVYAVEDLRKPILTVTQGKGATAVAFDPVTGKVYSNKSAQTLLRYSAAGAREQEYALDEGTTRQVLVHPEGQKLLVLTSARLYAAAGKDEPEKSN